MCFLIPRKGTDGTGTECQVTDQHRTQPKRLDNDVHRSQLTHLTELLVELLQALQALDVDKLALPLRPARPGGVRAAPASLRRQPLPRIGGGCVVLLPRLQASVRGARRGVVVRLVCRDKEGVCVS